MEPEPVIEIMPEPEPVIEPEPVVVIVPDPGPDPARIGPIESECFLAQEVVGRA